MLLAVDIGNTNVKLGLFHSGTLIKTSIAVADGHLFEQKITEFMSGVARIEAAIVSSVVPNLAGRICAIIRPRVDMATHIVSHMSNTGLTFALPFPERVGADRITAAAWGYHYFGEPVAVVDFGTATTISVVGQGGAFLGGAIIPGLRTMARSFNDHTASLPLVELSTPQAALGRDTNQAITSGIVYGTAGAVSAIIYEIEREIGYNLKIAATGGNLALVAPCLERVDAEEPDMLLKGLKMIYERMR
ncbi:MAG: type III pantothenate kinase [Candidatus Magnetominusculus sp. LBB02]|nr:type III pantothenate kinase [Candidatus Magnetominusculus sp. LBB02]